MIIEGTVLTLILLAVTTTLSYAIATYFDAREQRRRTTSRKSRKRS